MDITVDVCIIMDAYGLSQLTDENSFRLLEHLKSTEGWVITLDSRSKIRQQYDTKIKRGDGLKWLQFIYEREKYAKITWKKLPKGVEVKLQEEHFDSAAGEDYKYLITATNSDKKIIATRDPDYSPKIKKYLKKELGISVFEANEIGLAVKAD